MGTIEIILNLIQANNTTKSKLLLDLGLGKNSFVNWIDRGTSPSGDVLSRIADYFGVTTDYLLGRETEKTAVQMDDGLSPMDVRLMGYLAQLSDDQKKFLLAQIETLLKSQE